VTDNGAPSLSDSETFTVVVLSPPAFGSATLSGGNLTLTWETAPGQIYRVEYKDDLGAPTWTALPGDLLASGSSLSLKVSATTPLHRFYRLQLAE
jgi:hypothetical protein